MFNAYLPALRPVLTAALAATVLGLATACSTSQSRLEQASASSPQPIADGWPQGHRAVGQAKETP